MDTEPQQVDRLDDESHCPVSTTLEVLGGRWKPLILFHLGQGPARFNVLRRLIPAVTQRMLTAHLRELEGDGLVHRNVLAIVPPHVEYSLTPLGRSLRPILQAMADWGAEQDLRRGPDDRAPSKMLNAAT